jgi:RNA polymerase-binding transcription factor DksA
MAEKKISGKTAAKKTASKTKVAPKRAAGPRSKAAAKPKASPKARTPAKEQEPSEVAPRPKKTPFTDKELEYFESLILERRTATLDDIDSMRSQLTEASDQAGVDSAFSFHMADAGTDAMEREKFYMLIERQQTYVGYLDRALDRIANRTYGVCKVTGKKISKERLEVVPHTEISIEAKKAQEVK